MEENIVEATPLSLYQLSTLDTCDLVRAQTERAEEMQAEQPDAFKDAPFALSLTDLRSTYGATAETLKYAPGHEASDSVTLAEKFRDRRVGMLWKTVDYEADRQSDTAAGSTAAGNIKRLRKSYVGLANWPVGRETEGINALVQQARNNDFAASFATLNAHSDVDALDAAQKEYERLYNYREADYAAKAADDNPKTQTLLKLMRIEYGFFISHVVFMAYKYPGSAWPKLLAALNVKRAEYAAKLSLKATLAKKAEAKTAEATQILSAEA